MEDITTLITEFALEYGLNILGAIIILVVGRWLLRALTNMLRRVLARRGVDEMLVRFATNILYWLGLAVIFIAILQNLGFATTSVVAMFGALTLAIGFALQDSLSNFAAGVMLIFFRPFKVDDLVEIAGATGVVQEVQIFTTVLNTPDNKKVIIPNSKVIGDNITNYSANGLLRIDMVFGIGYDDSIPQAKRLLEEIIRSDDRVMNEPAPTVAVLELGDSSVNFAFRPYVKVADYWGVYVHMTEQVKLRFDEAGLSIPYPQHDVHLFQQGSPAA
ncbi:MAG: mechanosensitive ion channel [Anaerolineales bacterium]|nr:mechanosensitive ion channel [Anaerolineales bacterium]